MGVSWKSGFASERQRTERMDAESRASGGFLAGWGARARD